MALLHRRFGSALAFVLGSSAMLAQTQGPLPIKMGLWEVTVNQTMTGLQLPPEVEARMKAEGRPMPGSSSTTVQTCYSEEVWRKSLGDLPSTKDRTCTRKNVVMDSRHMSQDIACVDANNQPTLSGHMEMIFDSMEQVHGTMAMTGTQPTPPGAPPGRPGVPLDVQTKITAHFLSLNCGDLHPGESNVMSSR